MTLLAGVLPMEPAPAHYARIVFEPRLTYATRVEDAGAAAMLVLGSTKEEPSPADAEPRRAVENTVDLADGQVPDLAGSSPVSPRTVLAWTCGVASPQP